MIAEKLEMLRVVKNSPGIVGSDLCSRFGADRERARMRMDALCGGGYIEFKSREKCAGDLRCNVFITDLGLEIIEEYDLKTERDAKEEKRAEKTRNISIAALLVAFASLLWNVISTVMR